LLTLARDRDACGRRKNLRERLQQFNVAPLDTCPTSHHVHLLVDAWERSEFSGFMRAVAGEFGWAYNHRKRQGKAYRGDNAASATRRGRPDEAPNRRLVQTKT
jgi:hypothetical protein